MKTFKNGQKVRHPKYGEGEICLYNNGTRYEVFFSDVTRLLQKVGDDFYNQLEAVEDLPEVGKYAYFWNEGYKSAFYTKYKGKTEQGRYVAGGLVYKYISKTPPKFD